MVDVDLRNINVPCHFFFDSRLDFKLVLYQISGIACVMTLILLHVNVQEWPCRPGDFKGQEHLSNFGQGQISE